MNKKGLCLKVLFYFLNCLNIPIRIIKVCCARQFILIVRRFIGGIEIEYIFNLFKVALIKKCTFANLSN